MVNLNEESLERKGSVATDTVSADLWRVEFPILTKLASFQSVTMALLHVGRMSTVGHMERLARLALVHGVERTSSGTRSHRNCSRT